MDMQFIIILLLLIIILLLLDISSRIPRRDYVKEAMQRDKDQRDQFRDK